MENQMRYKVSSGDLFLEIDQQSHYSAALEAIQLWSYKKIKPILSPVIVVNDNNREIIISTTKILEQINANPER
jgi:hypothetical protein